MPVLCSISRFVPLFGVVFVIGRIVLSGSFLACELFSVRGLCILVDSLSVGFWLFRLGVGDEPMGVCEVCWVVRSFFLVVGFYACDRWVDADLVFS